ncbi:hypothetical protein BsWGS_28289 [Bradybaena similaris]
MDYSVRAVSEEMKDKCHLAADRYEECDKDNESSQNGGCKQDTENMSKRLEDGTGCKQDTENMPKRLEDGTGCKQDTENMPKRLEDGTGCKQGTENMPKRLEDGTGCKQDTENMPKRLEDGIGCKQDTENMPKRLEDGTGCKQDTENMPKRLEDGTGCKQDTENMPKRLEDGAGCKQDTENMSKRLEDGTGCKQDTENMPKRLEDGTGCKQDTENMSKRLEDGTGCKQDTENMPKRLEDGTGYKQDTENMSKRLEDGTGCKQDTENMPKRLEDGTGCKQDTENMPKRLEDGTGYKQDTENMSKRVEDGTGCKQDTENMSKRLEDGTGCKQDTENMSKRLEDGTGCKQDTENMPKRLEDGTGCKQDTENMSKRLEDGTGCKQDTENMPKRLEGRTGYKQDTENMPKRLEDGTGYKQDTENMPKRLEGGTGYKQDTENMSKRLEDGTGCKQDTENMSKRLEDGTGYKQDTENMPKRLEDGTGCKQDTENMSKRLEDGTGCKQDTENMSKRLEDGTGYKQDTENMPKRLEDGTGYKQDTENMPKRLEKNQELLEILDICQPLHSTFPFRNAARKDFTKNESHADTEDNDLPCKNQGLRDVSDSQFEENCPELNEIYCSQDLSKAVAEEMSHEHCACSRQRRSHRKRRIYSHELVPGFSSAKEQSKNFEHSLGLLMKFDPVRHIPWRHSIQTYNQPSSVTSTLHVFMNFEVFRLSSFDLTNFPNDESSFVTNLAKSGFYFVSSTRQIICFQCGNKYERSHDSSASSVDRFHHPQCTRHETNKPLDQSIQGLNLDALAEYFIQNGSLTSYHPPNILPSAAEFSEKCTSKNVPKDGPISDLRQATSDNSSGYESGGFRHVKSEREAHLDSQRSANDLNTGDGREQSEPDRSHLILTSATRWPVRFGSALSRYAEVRGDATAEGGAVGGIPLLRLDSASYPQFSIEAVRRKSFTDWNPRHSHKPDDLAAAGFFYAGYSDCVRCFYCGLGLKVCRPDDIPAYQHARYRPHCRFNRLYKGQDYIDTVLQQQRSEQRAGFATADATADATAEGGAVGGIPILNLDSASYPQFSTEAVRRKSFTDWNPWHSHKPEDLVAAAFFYADYSDCVRCFYCGLGLKVCRPDDIPAYQHARYRPHCQFNRLYKGQDYIGTVLQEQRSEHGATEIAETQTAPTEMVETQTAPTEMVETQTAPTETVETQTPPTETVETQTAPTETVETQTAPTETVETQTPPTETVETQTAPTETVETQTAPTEMVETQTAPTDMVEVQTAPTHLQDSVQARNASQVTRGPRQLDPYSWSRDQDGQAVIHIHSVIGDICLEHERLADILIHVSTQEEPSQNLLSDVSLGSNESGTSTVVSQLASSSPGGGTLANALTVPDDGQDRQVATQRIPDAATPAGTSVAIQPQARVPSRWEILQEREHTLLEKRVTCRLCRSKAVGCIYLPCGHVIACQECADNATHCVVCSKVIIGTANIYF